MLKLKGSIIEEEVEDSPWEESSVEGGEDIDEELEDSNDDEEAKGVPQEDCDDLVLSDPEGNTLMGCLMLNWKISHKYVHVIAQVAHIVSHHPVVQEFVKKRNATIGKNAAEYLI